MFLTPKTVAMWLSTSSSSPWNPPGPSDSIAAAFNESRPAANSTAPLPATSSTN